MTAPLQDKQFQLDGSELGIGAITFGAASPVRLEAGGWRPTRGEARVSDTERPGADGVRMGREYRGAPTWSWSLYTNGDSEEEGWAHLGALARVWENPAIRSAPDVVVPLRYKVAGKARRVYGRPRRLTEIVDNLSLSGRIPIEADFTLTHPLVFDDQEQSVPFTVSPDFDAQAGVIVPFIPPFTSAAGASTTVGTVTVGGEVPTPVTLVFDGPLTNATVHINGWDVELADPVQAGDPVTVDGRPWARTALTSSGAGVRVNARTTRLSKMWLPPGTHTVVFAGNDPTNSASLLVRWRDAYSSPR